MSLFWIVSPVVAFGLIIGLVGIYFAERERRENVNGRRPSRQRDNQARA